MPTVGSPGTAASDAPTVTPRPVRKSRRFTSAMGVLRSWASRVVRGDVSTRVALPVARWSDHCQDATIMDGVPERFPETVGAVARGIGRALRRRWAAALATVAAVLALDVLVPPLLLSAVRKPWTYFTFNPWLKRAPEYLLSDRPWAEKLDFLSRVALFWFSAEGAYGQPEWGFAVDTADVARFLFTALLIGVYVALWLERRAQGTP